MQKQNNDKDAFFALLKAGLFPIQRKNGKFHELFHVKWETVYQLAQEQSVQGLVLQGLEWYKEHKSLCIPQGVLLQWIGEVQIIEQQNKEMNAYIANLIEKLRRENVHAILVKGQGIAQCYVKPLWRACGDVDLLMSEENYRKAKSLLIPESTTTDVEEHYGKHIGLTIDGWSVELHGTQRCELSSKMDKVIDETQDDVFCNGNVRTWDNRGTTVFLPSATNDVIFVFTHFIKHFFKEGVGLRQICDWCRLLWKYRNDIDVRLLETRLRKMRLMSEWKAFGVFAVEYLGMPVEAMPFLERTDDQEFKRYMKKAELICQYVLEVGNFGHNRDMSYYCKYPYIVRKAISFIKRTGYLIHHASIFPCDSLVFFPSFVSHGVKSVVRGE